MFWRAASVTAALLASVALRGPASGQELPAPPVQAPPANGAPLLTIGTALRLALSRNPELLNTSDFLLSARWNERAVRSTFLPQVTPFFAFEKSDETGQRTDTYGLLLSEQFLFGTAVDAQVIVDRQPQALGGEAYAGDYRLTLRQPLLRGADPAVTAEPLRFARRSTTGQERAVETARRRTVLLVYQAYLGVARGQEALKLAADRVARAQELTSFSRARFSAGSVSRLDVLRAEQQEASTVVTRNDGENALDDFRDLLRRTAGLTENEAFSIEIPLDLPLEVPDFESAVAERMDRRPEALEARDQVTDAEFALRIAKSLELPSLNGFLRYEGSGGGGSAGDALHFRNPAFVFGLSSQYGLNSTVLHARKRQAQIDLGARKRNFVVLEDDFAREVRRAYRRLDALKRNHAIAVENEQVAELQAEVARLRFEKGLSDNFNVVDAENLLNAARLLELDSRVSILLARLDCLYSSGRLDVNPFLNLP
ncbi:MAG TPA: TolC family protein [Thermoanaerobaculia bacterium]|nr:TolC family protein [Thermoanaerobaculia bacterium]